MDPIGRFESALLEAGTLSPGDVENLRRSVEGELSAAIEFARQSPYPSVDSVADALWAE